MTSVSPGGPERESATTPRDAATVVVARDGAGGLEVFCVERHSKSGFMGGALVFPGGKVDARDALPEWETRITELDPRARSLASDLATARSYAVAALREALEEAALIPVVGGSLDDAGARALRDACAAAPLDVLLAERGLVLDASRLTAFSRWITPTAEPKRFDTRFYLLAAPLGQEGLHDDHETTKSFWATPPDVLERWSRGEVMLAPPTAWALGLFSNCADVEAAFRAARTTRLDPVEPRFVTDDGGMVLTLPGDPLHEGAGESPLEPGGPTRFVLEGGRFLPKRVG
ncbi:MAG TPA: hypothetical protein VHE30_23260 [Polyangiaceae bacterium]|nr:hypothetical protein [Polyangiaceae bacterium]